MKKLLYILVSIVFLTLGTSCKTKQITTDKIKAEQTENYDYLALIDFIKQNQSTKELNETEIKELKEIISSLNISYDGKDVNDKLDVLFKKLADGTTQLTLQGKGTANYNENSKEQITSLEKRLFARQDSIQKENIKYFDQFKSDLFAEINAKNKQVDSSGFTPGMWITIIITVIVMLCLNWLKSQFKRR